MRSRVPALYLSDAQLRVARYLRIHGSTARVHLAQALGINAATLTRLTQQLAAMGLIEEISAAGANARGRPTIPIAIAGHGGWSVGATVHPGWLELVVINFRGEIQLEDSISFDDPDPTVFAHAVDKRLRNLAMQRGFMHGRLFGLGVAVAGYTLDGDRNQRQVVDWIAPWSGIQLAETLGDVLNMPIWIENDATAAALAEFYRPEIMRLHRSALVIFLGHGVGGGLIADRDLFGGENNNAGEVGQLFPGDAPRPSGIDLLQTLRAAGAHVTSLAELDGLMGRYPEVFERWIERAADQLALAVHSGIAWLDPGAIIISGALPEPVLTALTNRLRSLCIRHLRGFMGPKPPFYASSLGSKAVVLGAALAPLHSALHRSS